MPQTRQELENHLSQCHRMLECKWTINQFGMPNKNLTQVERVLLFTGAQSQTSFDVTASAKALRT